MENAELVKVVLPGTRRHFLRTAALGLAALASGLGKERGDILPKQAEVVTTELGLFVQYEEPVDPNQQDPAKKGLQDKDEALNALVDHYSAASC